MRVRVKDLIEDLQRLDPEALVTFDVVVDVGYKRVLHQRLEYERVEQRGAYVTVRAVE